MLFTRFWHFLCLFVILTVSCVVITGLSASAQEDPGIQLRPAILDISGQPGKIVKTSVVLTNTFSQPAAVSVLPRSLALEDEPIDPSVIDSYDASLWVSLPTQNFLIDSFDSIEVPIEITVPEDAVPGGHYTLISFRLASNDVYGGSGVKINREAGVVTLVTVPGELIEIVDINTDEKQHFSFGGVSSFKQTVMNLGNNHVLPIISTTILNSRGDVVARIDQPPKLLLPNTKRQISVDWDSKKYFGMHSAVTLVSYGTPSQSETSEKLKIIIMPSVSTIILWIVIATILIRVIHKYYYNKNSTYHTSFIKNRDKTISLRRKIWKQITSKIVK